MMMNENANMRMPGKELGICSRGSRTSR